VSEPVARVRQRRRPRRRPAWETVLGWTSFAVFVVVALGPALLPGNSLFASDIVTNSAPWRPSTETAPLVETTQNPWLGDTVDAVNPQIMLVADGLREGALYQWDPYTSGGTMLAATPNSAAFSPISLPWLLFPGPYAPVAVKLLELAAIAVGMALLLRRWGLAPAVAPVAATVYASSGFLIAWTNWPQTRVAALIPLLFWAVDRAVVERRARDALAVALVLASMFFGGFPAVTAYALYAVVVYAVLRAVTLPRERRSVPRSALWSITGIVGGVGLAAWQLVPFALQSLNVIDFEVREQTTARHLRFSALATALFPDIMGRVDGAWWRGTDNLVERLSYVGVAALVLALVALVMRNRGRAGAPRGVVAYAAVGTLVCVVLIYVGGAPLGLVQQLPVFSNNYIGRLRVIFGFFVALLAAAGLSALLARGGRSPGTLGAPVDDAAPEALPVSTWRDRAGRARDVAVVLLVVGTAVAAVVAALGEVADSDAAASLARFSLVVGAGIAVLAVLAVLVLALLRGRGVRLAALATVLALVTVPGAALARQWWPVTPAEDFYPDTAVHDFLADNLGENRFLSYLGSMVPGSSAVYELRAVNGHGFHTQQWKDLLVAVDPDVMVSATYSTLTSLTDESLTSPVLDQLSVKYVVAAPGSPVVGTPEESDGEESMSVGAAAIGEVTGTVRSVMVDIQENAGASAVELALVGEDGTVLGTSERSADVGRVVFTFPDIEVDGTATVRLTSEGGADASVVVRATDAAEGRAALTLMRPSGDGIHLVFTDGADVYERDTVLDRVRWAGTAVLEQDGAARVGLLASGELDPGTVLLQDADLTLTQSTATAQVEVERDDPGAITVQVDAAEDGWLVVGDSWAGGGWWATVDGVSTRTVVADHALGAVAVPAGEHTVELTYRAPGLRLGIAVSVTTVLVIVLVLAVPPVVRRVRRRPAAEVAGEVG
jgi:hypothetical protein